MPAKQGLVNKLIGSNGFNSAYANELARAQINKPPMINAQAPKIILSI